MKVAVVPNLTREKAAPITRALCEALAAVGIEPLLPETDREALGGVKGVFSSEAQLYGDSEIVMPVGGDGSVIRAGKRAAVNGKRILGDNKTWTGFGSMVVLTAASQVGWGAFCDRKGLNARHDLYRVQANTAALNLSVGALCGLAYAAFELPNSFLKRRLDIRPGKTEEGAVGKVFFVVDQIDSLLGVFLVLKAFTGMSWARYAQFICLGAGTHVGVNFVLYKLHIRKNL